MATKKRARSSTKSAGINTTASDGKDVALPAVDMASGLANARHVADRIGDPAVRARFASLPKSEFDMRHVDGYGALLDEAASAGALYQGAVAGESEARVPITLVARAMDVKTRMFSCAEHTLDEIDDARRRVEAIRPGTGNLDLVRDLVGLASLYADYPSQLAKDGHKYRASDATDAASLAAEMQLALASDQRASTRKAARAWASAFAKLQAANVQVMATGRWLDRDRDDAAERWPSLFAVLAAPSKRSTKKKVQPAPTPAT